MKVDETVVGILAEVQQEMIDEQKVELSMQELGEIVNSQFMAANYAFKKGVEVRLPLFGSFIRKHGKKKMDDTDKIKARRAELGDEEFEKLLYAYRIKTKKNSKIRPPKITLKQLRDTKDIVKVRSKYDKHE